MWHRAAWSHLLHIGKNSLFVACAASHNAIVYYGNLIDYIYNTLKPGNKLPTKFAFWGTSRDLSRQPAGASQVQAEPLISEPFAIWPNSARLHRLTALKPSRGNTNFKVFRCDILTNLVVEVTFRVSRISHCVVMVNVSDLRSRKAGNVQKKLKRVLPIWFSRLGIRVKKKEAVSLFLGSAVISS